MCLKCVLAIKTLAADHHLCFVPRFTAANGTNVPLSVGASSFDCTLQNIGMIRPDTVDDFDRQVSLVLPPRYTTSYKDELLSHLTLSQVVGRTKDATSSHSLFVPTASSAD